MDTEDTPLTFVPNYAGHLTNIPQIEAAASRAWLSERGAGRGRRGASRAVARGRAWGVGSDVLGLSYCAWLPANPSPASMLTCMACVACGSVMPSLLLTRMDAAACISQGGCETAPLCLDILHIESPCCGLTEHGRHYWRHGPRLSRRCGDARGRRMDGVEVQAQALENLLSGIRLVRPSPTSLVGAARLRGYWQRSCSPGCHVCAAWFWRGDVPGEAPRLCVLVVLSPSPNGRSCLIRCLLSQGMRWCWSCCSPPDLPPVIDAGENSSRPLELNSLYASARRENSGGARCRMGLLPAYGPLPVSLITWRSMRCSNPAKEVGGDLYDAFMLDEHHFFFVVGDVAGKACQRRCLWH